MKASEHIVHVDESDFQFQVLAYSNEVPVVVDFWAEWCGPCKILDPTLEKLANQGGGSFRLAKVDVDANPSLAMQYQVSGIPAVKAFQNGQVVAEFVGARSEPEVREFLRSLDSNQSGITLEKGNSLLIKGEWSLATEAFGEALASNPDNAQALLGLAKSHIAQGNLELAMPILREFPASKEYSIAEQLLPLAEALITNQQSERESEMDELQAAFSHALKLVTLGNLPSAIDGMLDILRRDKNYRYGEVRKLVVALLHLLGEENPQTKEFRNELSSLLF